MKKWLFATAMLLSGCGAHSQVPVGEMSNYAPETLRQLLSGKVYVHERATGRTAGHLAVIKQYAGGKWRGCGISPAGKKTWKAGGTWKVDSDSRGRAIFSATVYRRSVPHRIFVVRYEPATGDVSFRRRSGSDGWVTSIRGWLQERWPRSVEDICSGIADGDGIDERQTSWRLAMLRRQAPDAPLKHLATPLPKPAGKQSMTPAGPASGALYGHGVSVAAAADAGPGAGFTEEERVAFRAVGIPEELLPAMANLNLRPGAIPILVEKGWTLEDFAEFATHDVAMRASDMDLHVVSTAGGTATVRSLSGIRTVSEGDRIGRIGRVARITPAGQVWLEDMGDPLPSAR